MRRPPWYLAPAFASPLAPVLALGLALGLATPPPAEAGSGATPITHFTADQSADFAKQIERDLAARGARLALVFRTGRPREDLPEGVRYTHGALWVYTPIVTEEGEVLRGYAVHNLYHGEEDRRTSYLHQDWPVNFTQGDVIGEAGVIIPSPEMQRRLVALLQSDTAQALHNPDYSLISNPHDERYQNCNEYLLDLIAAAAWETTDRAQIKLNLEAHFQPQRIRTGLLERMLGPSVDERIRLEDHRGPIRTTSFSALAGFMQTHGLASDVYEIEAEFLSAEADLPSPRPSP